MNYDDDDDNDDNMNEDYEVEGNEEDDDDDEFSRFNENMYSAPSQGIGKNQSNACNDKVKYSMTCHGSKNIEAYSSHIYNPNPFQ